MTGAFSQVLSNSMVNEVTAGFSHNHYGFRVGTGKLVQSDYTDYYRQNFRSIRLVWSPSGHLAMWR
jgi:hypothetical protein